jgi:plastocyanin
VKALAAALAGTIALAGAAPARMQVVAREFSFSLSRTRLPAGQAVIELANFGQDPHDLRLQRVGARHIAGTPVVAPGSRAELAVKLLPGRYSLWCSVANHRARGMRATLVVR